MKAFGHQHYVATLRAKQGEFDAVSDLTPDVRDVFTPLWEILASDATEEGEPTTALEPAIGTLPDRIHNASKSMESFVDCGLLEPSRRMASGEHPISWLCKATAAKGTLLTPVVALDSEADYVAAAADVHGKLNTDAAVRLTINDLKQLTDIQSLINDLGIAYGALHLIIDCEHVTDSVATLLPAVLPPIINPVLALGPWKTVTLLSGAIPEDYSTVPPGITPLPRLEWALWNALVTPGTLTHRSAFGDYAVAHAVYRFVPWYYGAASAAKIRYTALNDYYIFRGHSLKIAKHGGFDQFFGLAAQVVAHAVYRGAAYSSGDQYIADCAVHAKGPGNLQTWVEVCTNQHITYVGRLVPTIP